MKNFLLWSTALSAFGVLFHLLLGGFLWWMPYGLFLAAAVFLILAVLDVFLDFTKTK